MENNVYILESKTIIEQVVAVVIPIITAILTYLTFLHQRRAFKEEQFKSTFYQTQKFHRKLADVLRVNVSLITEEIDVVYRTFLGRQCFLFANNEVQSIIEALSQKRYLGDLKDTDIESINQWQIRQDEYSDNEKERRKAALRPARRPSVLQRRSAHGPRAQQVPQGLHDPLRGHARLLHAVYPRLG